VLEYRWDVNREEAPDRAAAALALLTLLCAVFLTAAILLGGFAEARLCARSPCSVPCLLAQHPLAL
jgi:hypothetical protein